MHFIGVLIAVAGLSSWIVTRSWEHSYIAEAAEHLGAHTAAILARSPDASARATEARELANELHLALGLFDANGRPVVLIGDLSAPAHGEAPPDHARVVREGRAWYVTAPVHARDGTFTLRLAAVSFMRMPWSAQPFALLGLTLIVVALAVRPLARRISRPIEWIIMASRRFGAGELSTRIQLPQWKHHHHHHHHRRRLSPKQAERLRRWQSWQLGHRIGDELYTLILAWNDMAERIERQVGAQRELLANVSHELRSPLARVRMALALLPEDPATQKRILDIEADLGELDALIEQILETSRLEATGLPTHTERFASDSLLDEVLGRAAVDPLTSPLAATRRPDDPVITIDGDRALLRRALFNLVENAAKYGAAPVELSVERSDAGVALVVTDHGAGVAAEERERVLRPFIRGDRAHTPGRGGVGLGLSFAARVAHVHGGSIELGDASPHGLVVRLHLPASRVVADQR
jgi:signal transduction histidine kinase